ncbi:MAG TPA: hypothetical protein VLO09_06795 [Ornithinimicrobium sp.]|nr:hypothetical protein [Ornithinimicrobium sp.]
MTGRTRARPPPGRTEEGSDMGVTRCAVVGLEGVVALAGVGGGAAMMADPREAMGLSPSMLDRLPVRTWFVPGAALVACNGILPAAVAVAELRGRRWPRRGGHVVAGLVLLSWPVGETVLFGYPLAGEPRWLRPAVAATGVVVTCLGVVLRQAEDGEPSGDGGAQR